MRYILFIAAAVLFVSECVQAQSSADVPVYTIIVTRHGVRAPTWTPERLNAYSAAPWPDFSVQPGYLTPHGFTLMKIMGEYYRGAYLHKADKACAGVYFWADTDQRTIESARALAEGIMPGCDAKINSAAKDKADPLFDPEAAGVAKQDVRIGLAAVAGRIGPDLNALIEANRAEFAELNQILTGGGKVATPLMAQPITLTAGKDGASMSGPLNTASTFTENLLLEYANGMSGAQLGWGRMDAASLQRILRLHTTYADLMRRTPYLAGVRGSNLLSHIVRSLEQAMNRKPVKGALGGPETTTLVISGHDTNLSNLSGMLGLSWQLPSYQRDDAPPGGAMIFSLWRASSGGYSVRVQFVAATMDQMHNATPLTEANPPARAELFVPGCSTASQGYGCEWNAFAKTVSGAIQPSFVQ
jgi:4-phytase / acid phosphatase